MQLRFSVVFNSAGLSTAALHQHSLHLAGVGGSLAVT